jgi:hypothetical protein
VATALGSSQGGSLGHKSSGDHVPWVPHVDQPVGLTCRLNGHPHLIGAHAARLVQVKLPEDGLGWGGEGEDQAC